MGDAMNKRHGQKSGSYIVGRGRPPKEHQFQPGKSGNPGGRKKATRNLSTLFAGLAETEIEVKEKNGGRRSATAAEALGLRLVQEGLQGDTRAINTFFQLHYKFVQEHNLPSPDISDQDEAILNRALGPNAARLSPLSASSATMPTIRTGTYE